VNQLDVPGKQILQREPVDRVRVPAADLHDSEVPIAIRQAANLRRRLADE
jgi:hypothetical protein